jgi:hypothetical protein
MTIAMRLPMGRPSADADGASWRALRGGLWVARRDGRHLGTVEHGRRWLASDAEGEPVGAFRTFREAQAAVADPAAHRAPVHRSSLGPALATAGLAVAAAASAAASVWVWTTLLP